MYLKLNIIDFCNALIRNKGQDIEEAVWDLVLESKPTIYYLKIVDELKRRNETELALRFLTVAFKRLSVDGYE